MLSVTNIVLMVTRNTIVLLVITIIVTGMIFRLTDAFLPFVSYQFKGNV